MAHCSLLTVQSAILRWSSPVGDVILVLTVPSKTSEAETSQVPQAPHMTCSRQTQTLTYYAPRNVEYVERLCHGVPRIHTQGWLALLGRAARSSSWRRRKRVRLGGWVRCEIKSKSRERPTGTSSVVARARGEGPPSSVLQHTHS